MQAEISGRKRRAGVLVRVAGASVGLALVTGSLGGCRNDLNSFFDPSVVGRWEYTPTVVPILERLDVIEDDSGDFVETSEILPEDLIPEPAAYEIGAGDQIRIIIFDFLVANQPSEFVRVVDARGMLDLPQIGELPVRGMTAKQIELLIVRVLREQGIIQDALVTAESLSRQDATFTVFGAIARVGRYGIPKPNYRLLDALTDAGGTGVPVPSIFVIRQAPLSAEVSSGLAPVQPRDPAEPRRDEGANLEDLIDRLTEPPTGEEPPSPGVFGAGAGLSVGSIRQPAEQVQPDRPPIDLPAERPAAQPEPGGPPAGQWVYIDGRWVRVAAGEPVPAGAPEGGLAEGPDPLSAVGADASDLVTQRVIEIPLKPLLQGNAAYNIVIRPGDAIRIPPPDQGLVYMAGPGIARPGVFNLPAFGRLTLTKAVAAAGGLSPIGIANRTDLTRMIGDNRQATIRLNLRAIYEGAEPDVFLKPDDVINVGTTWWAQPLAIFRNGFRVNYGFGFLLDRNFGNDVFGAPPTNFRN